MAADDGGLLPSGTRGLKTIVTEMEISAGTSSEELAASDQLLTAMAARDAATNELVAELLKDLERTLKGDVAAASAEMDRRFTTQNAENKRTRHDCEGLRSENLAVERRVVALERRVGACLRSMGLEGDEELVEGEEED
jgi:hypothetical protein